MTIDKLKSSHINKIRASGAKVEEHTTAIEWTDGFTGEQHTHYVDLTIYWPDGVEYVDFAENALPLTKYLYAQNQLDNWRLVTINPSPVEW